VWRATAGHRGRKEAMEGRAGPSGDMAALLSSGFMRPPTTLMNTVENTEVETEI